jgi:hypothetical protein
VDVALKAFGVPGVGEGAIASTPIDDELSDVLLPTCALVITPARLTDTATPTPGAPLLTVVPSAVVDALFVDPACMNTGACAPPVSDADTTMGLVVTAGSM